MIESIEIGGRRVGCGHPVYVIGEIGINHNGDMDICKRLIDAAVSAGCDAVKFQKRTPELCVPEAQKAVMRDTPWGQMTYLDYKHRLEFTAHQYAEISAYCADRIDWFASCWDIPAVDFIASYNPVAFKIASASLTDDDLLTHTSAQGKPVLMSTGMSTADEITHAFSMIPNELALLHTTSSYPCPPDDLNLRMIETLQDEYGVPVGYSGHETGLQTTIAAVALGACIVERHITLDRAMWGTDQAASVEPVGLQRLVRDIRIVERALGDGVKRVYPAELPIKAKLRLR